MSKLTILKEVLSPDSVKVSFEGIIDEDFSTNSFMPINENKIILDFGNLKLINSCGIRELVSLIRLLKNKAINYERVPKILIHQFNLVEGFLSRDAKIISFYCPYYCSTDDSEYEFLINSSDVIDQKAPVMKHPKTGEELEFDDNARTFFKFIK